MTEDREDRPRNYYLLLVLYPVTFVALVAGVVITLVEIIRKFPC